MQLSGRASLSLAAAIGVLSIACGATAPSPVPGPPATGLYAPDLTPVTQGIIDEFRDRGWEVVMAERADAASFSVAGQRIRIPSLPGDSVTVRVYRTAELAENEASRLGPDGNVRPDTGIARVHVDYAGTMHFYYRDRVIASYFGCDAAFKAALEAIFGAPIVVTGGSTCWRLGGN